MTWIATVKNRNDTLLTSAIPQLGFVRVSVQRTAGQLTVKDAAETLARMIRSQGRQHSFLSDDHSAEEFPEWCQSAGRTTDAHLLRLAEAHAIKLATLDAQIPAAYLLPVLEKQR